MTVGLGLALLVLAGLALVAVPRHLLRAQWPARAPATAVQLWQAALFTGLFASLGSGALLGLRPLHADLPHALVAAAHGQLAIPDGSVIGLAQAGLVTATAALTVALVLGLAAELIGASRVRRRQVALLNLVATTHPEWPGVEVLDHPLPVAYSFAGKRPRIVVTRGTLTQLTPAQIRAVLAHEQAHLEQRHHLVRLPFAACRRSGTRLARLALEEVQGLLEMCADDAVRHRHTAWTLASALVQMAEAGASHRSPPTAFAAAERRCVDRISRLVEGPPRSRWLSTAGLAAAGTLLALPVIAIAVPCLFL